MDPHQYLHTNVTRNIWDASNWILIKLCLGGLGDDCHCFLVTFYKLQ